ncbi:hypothetical protein H0I54_11645 [Yersinia kristensenii]|uniref:hypothetical protein n=1 Tax=Yersinia kristensenii TaxID=28152 RepID=UPI001C60F192|nr:hypothetical protein [Yersinia kristensenii]MBW5842466.1 hypothetical protein [Yersinia kristensenii]
MFSITAIIELVKTGFGFFQKKKNQEENKDELNSQQNQITLEETRKGFTWRQALGYALTFIVFYNFVVIPLLALCGIPLPIVPLDDVWKVLIILIGGG